MADRETALRSLTVGDVFHARSPNRASLVCLVTSVSDSTIYARRITTQDELEFDRQTGTKLGDIQSKSTALHPSPQTFMMSS